MRDTEREENTVVEEVVSCFTERYSRICNITAQDVSQLVNRLLVNCQEYF